MSESISIRYTGLLKLLKKRIAFGSRRKSKSKDDHTKLKNTTVSVRSEKLTQRRNDHSFVLVDAVKPP